MTSYVTPKKNTAFIFYAGLPSQASPGTFQSNPTLAAGDFKVSIDGGALANLTTLPTVTPASGKMVKFSLSSSEMNGDNITVVCSDAAGAEWFDVIMNIQTSARQIDDLAYPATSGRSMVVDANGLVDANTVKIGPTGAGTAQTAKDVGGAVPAAAAGASGGLHINGSNSGTTTFAALTITGTTTMSNGLVVNRSTANTSAVVLTGNGTGSGLSVVGGTTGHGMLATGGATSGDGIRATAATSGIGLNAIGIGTTQPGIKGTGGTTTSAGMQLVGGATSGDGLLISSPTLGHGVSIAGAGASKHGITASSGSSSGNGLLLTGGSTSGEGLKITTTSGDGVLISPTAGHGINIAANGTSKHGIFSTGGTAGTSDGMSLVAGSGGVDLRANQTGNITGNLSGSAGSVSGAVGSVTGNVGGNVVGSVGSVTGLTASNLDVAVSSRMASYTQPTGFLAATFPATVASTTNITAGTITTVTNLTNAPTAGDFTAAMKTSLNNATPSVTVSDKTGFSLTAAYDAAKTAAQAGDEMDLINAPNPIAVAAIQSGLSTFDPSSDTVAHVTLVDTTTTNSDMRGTDNALLAASYTAPDNSSITAIKAKTDNLAFTVAGQVDANTKSMNDTTVNGTGIAADLWRGA